MKVWYPTRFLYIFIGCVSLILENIRSAPFEWQMYLKAEQSIFLNLGSFFCANKSYLLHITEIGIKVCLISFLSYWAGTEFQYYSALIYISANASGFCFCNSLSDDIVYFRTSFSQNRRLSIQFPGFERSRTIQIVAILFKLLGLRGAYNRLLNILPPPSS